jgi:hypothetical protein
MRIVHNFLSPKLCCEKNRQHCIQIDAAHNITRLKKQVKKKADIAGCVKQESFFKKTAQSFLMIGLVDKRIITLVYPNQRYTVAGLRKGCADADHPLVVIKLVGYRKNNPFQKMVIILPVDIFFR